KENRRVLIQWGANWCPWCVALHAELSKDKDLSRETLYEYELVLVDVGRRDKNMDLAQEYGVDLAHQGIPYLSILDAEGKVVVNSGTEAFEKTDDTKKGHDAQLLLAFLKQHRAEPWKAEERLAAALERARREDKRVFLHFGAPWCPWCHRLEDWMAA